MRRLAARHRYIMQSFCWVLALLCVASAVNLYYINKLVIVESGVWLPPLNFRYQFDALLRSFREQIIPILGLFALSFSKPFRLALKDQSNKRSSQWLFFSLLVMYGAFALDQYQLERSSIGFANHASFIILVVSLLLGARAGIFIGLLNLLVYGSLFHKFHILPDYPDGTFWRTLFSETHLFAPIFLAAMVGLAKENVGQERFTLFSLLFFAVFSELMVSLSTLISTWAPPYFFERFSRNIVLSPLLFFMFWLLRRYQLERNSGKLQLTQQELALVQAELRALRAQINPHFLLNSLSVIHHLIRTQPEQARDLVLDLSDVFQRTLRAGDFVPLREELEHVKSYLALEQARLTKRLNVQWSILPEDKLDVLVPTLIVQPIVENAVQHGLAPKPEGGMISILIKQRADDLLIEIADNGLGFDLGEIELSSKLLPTGASLGLRNIDYRLRLLYGETYKLNIESTVGVGTSVSLRIPCATEAIRPTLRLALEEAHKDKA